MVTRGSLYPTDSLFKGIKALLTSLPSEEEKNELLRTLSETQAFLDELRSLVETVPTMESSRELSEGLSRLDVLAERARSDAGIRRLIGLRNSTGPRIKRAPAHGDIKAQAMILKQRLSESHTSDIEILLERSREPLPVFVELANLLGMRTRSKERKADLISRIATHIENQRGYKILRGEESDLE